jgi:O-antigen ligase
MLLYAILALAGMTQRKMLFALSGAVALAIIAPVAISSFDKRFDEAPLTEDQYDERAAFNRAASFIVDDHPLGVGANHYVHVAKNYGYSERAGVAPSEVNRNNIVHNAYWLAMAETGYPGIVAFCLMLIVPMVTALRTGWRERHNAEGNLLIGCGVALLIAYIHSMYEWVIFGKEVQYLLFTTMGMIFGISLRMNALRDAAPQVRNIAMPYRPQGGTAATQGKLAGEGTW